MNNEDMILRKSDVVNFYDLLKENTPIIYGLGFSFLIIAFCIDINEKNKGAN